ncbi:MAG TPA: hypothetical protein VHY37_07070 [Tepidisphaeraceae bacterium]|jgi:hypothetical protein|nr:hypothetical protein [Tepidisphaeraceae bacterium]
MGRRSSFVVFLALLVMCSMRLAQADVPRIIFDSDMSSDHDDIGDIAILHGLASMGDCKIIGMMVSSQNGGTALCMDAINTYYGTPNIPIGVPSDIGGIGGYAGQIGTEFPHHLKSAKDCLLSADLYRKLLAASPDKSVTIVTTGFLNNLKALLLSKPDSYSPLSGTDLVRQKVKLWSCAGGAFPKGDEFNFRVIPDASYYVVNHWPVAVTYVGFDVGQDIYTCGQLPQTPKDNPIRRVYVDIKNQYPYPSWGQIAIYYAVRGPGDLWNLQNVGRNNCDEHGSNWWTSTPDPTGDEDQAYLLEKSRTPARESLDALIMLPPNDGKPSKPGSPSDLTAKVIGDHHIDLHWVDNAYNENGFSIERSDRGGPYKLLAKLPPNTTIYSDANDLPSTADVSYRVKAFDDTGDSLYTCTWNYSGWTEINFAQPTALPLYDYYQPADLRPARAAPGHAQNAINDHVTLNNDSEHGQNVTIDVDVTATGAQGNFYVYFLFQDNDNWYRLNVGEKSAQFQKRIAGKTTDVGPSTPIQNMGDGSPQQHWRIEVTPTSLKWIRQLPFASPADKATQPVGVLLNVPEPLSLTHGKLGLGGWARTAVWENFHFHTGSNAGSD